MKILGARPQSQSDFSDSGNKNKLFCDLLKKDQDLRPPLKSTH